MADKLKQCKICEKYFNYSGKGVAKYCSEDCANLARQMATQKRRDRTGVACNRRLDRKVCEACGLEFSFPSHGYNHYQKRRFCSTKCWYNYDSPLGDEKLQLINGRKEWCIKISTTVGEYDNKRWKRKAVAVVEDLVGRKLSRLEAREIKFVDGDTTNCDPSNLLLPQIRIIRVCKNCGESKVLRHVEAYRPARKGGGLRDLCNRCSRVINGRKGGASKISRNKLSEDQVALIKALPISPRQVNTRWGYKEGVLRATTVARWFLLSSAQSVSDIKAGKRWREVSTMAKKEVWKSLLTQHDRLCSRSNATLYDRVTILVQVFNDPVYKESCKESGKRLTEELDTRVRDTCANFTELLQMLKLFPQRKQWETGNISDMRAAMLDALRKERRGKSNKEGDEKEVKRVRQTATVSEMRDLQAENEKLKNQVKSANQIIKSLENQLETARETIGSLNETVSLFRMQPKQPQPKPSRRASRAKK